MIAKQQETQCDIVTGTRYNLGGGVFGWNFKRKLISNGANVLARTLLNPGVSDLTGSFRLYKRQVLDRIMNQDEPLPKGYAFQMAIIVRAEALGFKVEEVPIEFVDRIFGESKLGANEIITYLRGVFNLFFYLP